MIESVVVALEKGGGVDNYFCTTLGSVETDVTTYFQLLEYFSSKKKQF